MALTDLTRISTSGIATGSTIDSPILRKDVSLRGSQVGVTSALFDSSEDELKFNDNVKLKFGDGGDLNLYHTGSHSYIQENGSGNLILDTNGFSIKLTYNDSETMLRGIRDKQVEIYYDDEKKFETAETGAIVTGILTATGFSGPIVGNTSSASGISTFYDLRVSNNLTVEGTTTTLDTNLIGVDRVEIGANSNTIAGIAVTQSGTADIVNLFDGDTKVLTVKDGGSVGIGTDNPAKDFHVTGTSRFEQLDIVGFATFGSAGTRFFHHTPRIEMQGNNTATISFCNATTGTTNTDGMLMGFSSSSQVGFINVNESSHGFVLKTGGSAQNDERIRVSGVGTVSIRRGTEEMVTARPNGAVELHHNGNKRLETTGTGVNIFGEIAHIGDTDTKIEFTDNQIDLQTGGYSRLYANNYALYVQAGHPFAFLATGGGASPHIKSGGTNNQDLLFTTGSTNPTRIQIAANGKVGIGTDVPSELIDVYKTSNDALIKVRTTAAGAYFEADSASSGYYGIKLSSSGTDKWFLGSYNSGNFQIKDGSGSSGAERFTIEDSTGNVGIGTNNPQNKFEVYGTDAAVTLLNYGQSSGGLAAWTSGRLAFVSAHTNDDLVFGYSNSTLSVDNFVERMRIDNGTGEVKISDGGFLTIDTNPAATYGVAEALRIDDGAATGDRALQFFEYSHSGARYHRIQFNTNTTTNGSAYTYTQGNYGGSSSIEFDNSGHLSFFTNEEVNSASQDNITPTERLTIRSNGKIGIGVADPDELLHIFSQTSHSKIVLESDNNSANNGLFWVDEGDNTQTEFYYSHPDNKQFLKVNGNGFEIYSKQQSNVIAKIGHSNGYNDVVVPNGKLGVGTDNAGTTLDVFGNLQVKNKAAGLQNFFISESSFKFSQNVGNWSSMDYTSSPVLAWDYKSGPGDLFYIGSGGNTPIADQMALVVSDAHGFKVGKSGYDGSDFDVDSSNEFFRITTGGNIGINESNPTSKLVVDGQVVVNNSNLIVDKHHIDGTDDWAGASHQLHHKRTFTNNTWTNYFKLYRSTITANNDNVGVYGAMLHIVYINDRSNAVQTTGYDVFPFVVRARSSSTLSGTFGSALVDLDNVIGSSIEVRFDSATANQINIQIKVNNVDDGGSEQLVHAWIDGGGVASSSSLFLYPSILT